MTRSPAAKNRGHGTLERYDEGCRCAGCIIAAARDDATTRAEARKRRGEGGRFTRPPEPPVSFSRCGCGRLVWDFDTGLCGACA